MFYRLEDAHAVVHLGHFLVFVRHDARLLASPYVEQQYDARGKCSHLSGESR